MTKPSQQSVRGSDETMPAPSRYRWLRYGVLTVAIAILAVVGGLAADWYVAIPTDAKATYVGRDRCIQCHQQQHDAWHGSHHDRAMELATESAVLGDFNDTQFERFGVTTTFLRKGEKYYVNTEGRDGTLQDFEIKYTFGIDPLQQYMVEFPDGRVQVLRVAWDVNKQEWFYIPPPDMTDERIIAGDPMHWTGLSQNWNHMCAACHSTNLQKNFDLASNTYSTSFSEIDVSCEACHGPGSIHVDLAESISPFWDRNHGHGLVRLKGSDPANQLSTCATCHSRHGPTHPNFRPGDSFLDHYDLSLLMPGLYESNGQILDEVYVYGSFLQSKMHAEGVRCTDCHDPHSLKLKFTGNRLCAQCHVPGKYDTLAHHHHPPSSEGAQCAACHMPSRTYMVVDPRRDHQFAVPRPDLSVELGTPNACNDCHTKQDEDAAWAAEHVEKWFGQREQKEPHFAHAFAAAAKREGNAEELLVDVAGRRELPAIVRATAITLLQGYDSRASRRARSKAVKDSHPLVRTAGVRTYDANDAKTIVDRLAPQLEDEVRSVRLATVYRLAGMPRQLFSKTSAKAFDAALQEFRQAQQMSADRANAHMNLAQLAERLERPGEAEEHYRTAIRIEPYISGPRTNLAAILDARAEAAASSGGRQESIAKLRREVRNLREEEVELLQTDATLREDSPFVWLQLGRMLYLVDRIDEAQAALERAVQLDPSSYESQMFLTLLYEKQKNWSAAVQGIQRLLQLRPGDPQVLSLLQRIQQGAAQ